MFFCFDRNNCEYLKMSKKEGCIELTILALHFNLSAYNDKTYRNPYDLSFSGVDCKNFDFFRFL